MTATLSKRNQARNERALQELIKTIPGNDRCADCQARNPGWASWSVSSLNPDCGKRPVAAGTDEMEYQLGIFLCMRCAALHRKLGTHISKVKSLSMDTWSNDQVDNMKRNGNTISNRTYNPHNKKPTIPLDVDETDSAMERYIRQKYEQGIFSGKTVQLAVRHDTGSTGSSEEQPPPLPPKPTRRFGFGLRAASSTFPISRRGSDKEHAPAPEINSYASPHSELRINKQSRVFGTSLGDASNTELKMATLRDMGFPDDRRNLNVLKGLGGNLERAIESLVRLGEGTTPRPRSTSAQARIARSDEPIRSASPWNNPTSRSHFTKSEANPSTSDNIQGRSNQQITGQYQSTTNLTFTSTGTSQDNSYNPFETTIPHSSAFPLESTFKGLQLSQPLFPNATGGYPSQQQQQTQEARFQQCMTPPVPQLPHQNLYINPIIQSHGGSYNPFLQQSHHPPLSAPADASPPFIKQYGSVNSYGSLLYNNMQSQQVPQSAPPQQQQYLFNGANPMDQQATTSQHLQYSDTNISQAQPYQQFMDQSQVLYSQQTGRMDKRSILDLYNYPQLAPPPPVNNSSPATDVHTFAVDIPASDVDARPVTISGQRSVTMPVQLSASSKNPFHTNQATLGTTANAGMVNGNDSRHVTQDSTDHSRESQGRSSPDAFATLSSRFVR